jgi:hypothetical protein
MAKLIGMGGSVTVSTTAYAVSEWSVNVSNEVQDVTDTGSAGWVSRIGGVSSADVTFRAWWGGSVANFTTVFSPGTKVACSFQIGSGSLTVDGDFYIESVSITNNSKNAVEFQCTGKSDGTIVVA